MTSEVIECPLCSEQIEAFGVFDCGHFACFKCCLKIRRTVRRNDSQQNQQNNNNNRRGGRNNNNNNRGNNNNDDDHQPAAGELLPSPTKNPPTCHVCRKQIASLTITEMPPKDPDSFIYDKEELQLLLKVDNVNTKRYLPLNCQVTSDRIASKIQSLIDYLCPFDQCWDRDPKTGAKSQIPFTSFDLLQRHLRQDHHGCRYCDTCAFQSVSFLNELQVYTPNEYFNHLNGVSVKDSQAFTGHPNCLFCNHKTLLDGEAMLDHLKTIHYVCDFCNISSYKFCYYNDRQSLNKHWELEHKLCTHADCIQLDPVARVFASELDLVRHMQERHGVKTKALSLEAFGFRSAGSSDEIVLGGRNSNGNASVANIQQMASQSIGTTMITYDFVGSTKKVPLVPRTQNLELKPSTTTNSSSTGRRQPPNNRGSKAAQQQQQQQQDQQQQNSAAAAAAQEEAEEKEREKEAERKKLEDANQFIVDVAASLGTKQKEKFHDACKRYIKQEMKSVEFFNVLHTIFTEEETLELVFDNFAETLKKHPNPILRDALISAKSIVLSAEAKKAKEIAREEEDKIKMQKKKDEIRKLTTLTIQTNSNNNNGAAGRAKNVNQVGGGNFWQARSPKPANDESSNIYKKATSNPISPAANAWTARTPQLANTTSNNNNNNNGMLTFSNNGNNNAGSGSGSDDFGFSFENTNNNNNGNNNKKKNNNNHNHNNDDAPSLNEAFPTLPTTTRKGNPHPNQAPKPKGVWKNNNSPWGKQ